MNAWLRTVCAVSVLVAVGANGGCVGALSGWEDFTEPRNVPESPDAEPNLRGSAPRGDEILGDDVADAGNRQANDVGLPPLETGNSSGQSCIGGLDCGGVSCCQDILVPGGVFQMGRSISGSDAYPEGSSSETPEHGSTVAPYYLDTFEVTVGRFRRYVQAYDGKPPSIGAGAHPKITGSGWNSAWNGRVAPSPRDLMSSLTSCPGGNHTWTDIAGAQENQAVNCVDWFQAFAFCIWDGGRLPTEAEWEYAAAGGSDNRLYPWGKQVPTATHANHYFGGSPHVDVGHFRVGNGKWGHADLGGGMWEWTVDSYDSGWYTKDCFNCANVADASHRVFRGGGWGNYASGLRAATRGDNVPSFRDVYLGFRCARTP